MAPRSRSRSSTPQRSYTRSPVRRNGHNHKTRSRYSRGHSYSRSRSNSRHPRSPPPLPPTRNGRFSGESKSPSRSISPRYRRRVTRSRSSSRARYDKRHGTRDNPKESRCIGVFGLSVHTTQQQIREIFSKFGPINKIQVVIDAQTGRSRGFCFIYYEDIADAKAAKNACCGMELDGRRMRVDYSITKRPHTPTPGIYKGNPTRSYRERHRDERRSRRYSVSPNERNSYRSDRRRRYERSRSPSYSPKRSRY